jgi:hypothetical protein
MNQIGIKKVKKELLKLKRIKELSNFQTKDDYQTKEK